MLCFGHKTSKKCSIPAPMGNFPKKSMCLFYQTITTNHAKYQKKSLVPNLKKASSRNICNIQTLKHHVFQRHYVSHPNLGKKEPFLAMGALQRQCSLVTFFQVIKA